MKKDDDDDDVPSIDKKKVAIKIIEKKKLFGIFERDVNGIPYLINEIQAHWAVEHCPGVLKLLAIHEDSCYVELVLEYQPKGSLMECLEK